MEAVQRVSGIWRKTVGSARFWNKSLQLYELSLRLVTICLLGPDLCSPTTIDKQMWRFERGDGKKGLMGFFSELSCTMFMGGMARGGTCSVLMCGCHCSDKVTASVEARCLGTSTLAHPAVLLAKKNMNGWRECSANVTSTVQADTQQHALMRL